jgi:hypothetical protein
MVPVKLWLFAWEMGVGVGFQVAITNSDCIPPNFTGQTEQHEAHFNKQSNF